MKKFVHTLGLVIICGGCAAQEQRNAFDLAQVLARGFCKIEPVIEQIVSRTRTSTGAYGATHTSTETSYRIILRIDPQPR